MLMRYNSKSARNNEQKHSSKIRKVKGEFEGREEIIVPFTWKNS